MKKTRKRNTDIEVKDILLIHESIINSFEREYLQIPEMKDRIVKLEWITQNGSKSEKVIANKELKKMKTELIYIETGQKHAQYLLKTEKLLKDYKEILNTPIKIDFMNNTSQTNDTEKNIIINNYLSIAKNYTDTPLAQIKAKMLFCKNCNIDLLQTEELVFTCSECGYYEIQLTSNVSYQDMNRINSTQRYVYVKKSHFSDFIKKYQGKQNTSIPDIVISEINRQCRQRDLDPTKLTKTHITEFLKLNGHSKYTDDIHLLHHLFTGEQCDDISHLEDKLLSMFEQIEPLYEQIKPDGRINFLRGQYILYKLLCLLKHPCNEDDFKALITRDITLYHDEIWKIICDKLHWSFTPTA